MKKIIFLTFLLIFKLVFASDFYDIDQINSIEIYFSENNWDYILDSLYSEGNEDRLAATIILNGIQYDSVGVRYKGNSSYNPNQVKNPLNIKLDHIYEDQNIQGYGTLKLSNQFKDPTFIREVLSYEIARNYIPSSQANYINVYINNSYYGLYTSVQSVDKYFLGNHFFSNDYPFFKGELTGNPPQNPGLVWNYFSEDSSLYFGYYELRSDSGWKYLINFLDTLNNYNIDVENILDVDRHLWMLAFDNLCVNLDAPINLGHNYYLYQDAFNRFNPILWDLNENFGVFTMLMNGQHLNMTQLQQLDPFLNLTDTNYPIINKILSIPLYKKMYIAHIKTIIEEHFSNGLYLSRALEIQAIIDQDVQNDTNKFYSYNDFLNNIYSSVGYGPHAIIGIYELMEPRISYLLTLQEFIATQPDISNILISPTTISPYSTINITVEVNNSDQVYFAYRDIGSGIFQTISMYDDGNHNDGLANDSIYGNSLTVNSVDIQYYFYAENNETVKFSPQRAEYETYLLSISGDLVINEFLADNETTQADPHGEYDDWIEIYNNTDSSIILTGYFLSDDPNEPYKWIFPDTFINANDFLIIWADDDSGQIGLHANFKLSKSGEEIVFTNSSMQVLDQIIFGSQGEDTSTGRYPNGTGNFIQMAPSFSQENYNGFVGIEEIPIDISNNFNLSQNYPNPFSSQTSINFQIPITCFVELSVYNIAGQKIKTLINSTLTQGQYSINWDGRNNSNIEVAKGVYLYRFQAQDYFKIIKTIKIK